MSVAAPPPPADARLPPVPDDASALAPHDPDPAHPSHRALGVRLAAVLALALFGAQAWGDMVRPEAPGRLLAAAGVGGLLGLAALLCTALHRPARGLALGGVAAVGGVAALLLAGVPVRMLDSDLWDNLAGGLAEGIAALPGLSVPYRGVDEWNRVAMLLGGTLLAVAGPVLACWPGRSGSPAGPGVAAVLLAVLYAVPAVQLVAGHPFLDGAIFAFLLAAVLFAERLAPRDAPVVVPALAVAALIAVALAPRLDSGEPWIDYESIAQSIGERGTTSFSWEHGYGPLDWPRDGREVLRIRSSVGAYWKATTLADFDGVRWRETRAQGVEDDPAADAPNPRWIQRLRVSVRNLRTQQFVAAGSTLRIDRSPRTVVPGAPGSFVTGGRPLRRGHAYLARVYNPRPRSAQLEASGSEDPSELWPYLSMQLPRSIGGPVPIDPATGAPDPDGPDSFVVFAPWGDVRDALGYQGRGFGERLGTGWVQDSAYARTLRLARRLAEGATSPYDYVRRVQAHLQDGFTYTETPPQRSVPLDAFIFRDKAGYCQQFSGAMALLLRVGGVPARVAAGFTPGTLDRERNEYVVRDLDAHSWVEAYFPGIGWMPFDPTPAVAPPRAQVAGIESPAEEAADEDAGPLPNSERTGDPASIDSGAAAAGDGGTPLALLVLGGLGAALVLAAAAAWLVSHRRHTRMTSDDRVAELDRALRRSGRLPAQGLTLRALEERLRVSPAAVAYVRALRAGRYGFAAGEPTRKGRSAVRRELAAGLGLRGRARSLWALPPW